MSTLGPFEGTDFAAIRARYSNHLGNNAANQMFGQLDSQHSDIGPLELKIGTFIWTIILIFLFVGFVYVEAASLFK